MTITFREQQDNTQHLKSCSKLRIAEDVLFLKIILKQISYEKTTSLETRERLKLNWIFYEKPQIATTISTLFLSLSFDWRKVFWHNSRPNGSHFASRDHACIDHYNNNTWKWITILPNSSQGGGVFLSTKLNAFTVFKVQIKLLNLKVSGIKSQLSN